MSKLVVAVLVLATATFIAAEPLSLAKIVEERKPSRDDHFDYFYLSMQWPGSLCRFLHPCRVPEHYANNFTIHGLWPQRKDGSYPSNCKSSAGRFDYDQIESLATDLHHYWYDFKEDGTNFWAHEWNKHGVCATSLEATNTQLKYFRTTLNLAKYTPITAALAKGGVVPGDKEYPLEQVENAFLENLGGIPEMICDFDGTVKEFRFCFSKDLKLFDCQRKSHCDHLVFPSV
ncbi:ribonuclease 1 [Acrasis kona]|uniref:Ribonuclease 1 n=1 Tax=Acrasis kona TaxID=1008807 RepID=A0AAW2ZI82_9EUKA